MPRTARSAPRPLRNPSARTAKSATKKGKATEARPLKPVRLKAVKEAAARSVPKAAPSASASTVQAVRPTGPTVRAPSAPPPLPKTPSTIPPPMPKGAMPSAAPFPGMARLAAVSAAPQVPQAAPPAVLDEHPRFKVGDRCVHPAHGVGEVTLVERREIGGTAGLFYTLRILDNGIKVMVPVAAASQVGLRPIMSAKEADAVLDTMRAREVAVDLQPWSRRFRAYTEMMKTGSAYEIAKVLRDMYRLRFDKDLSFGERRLLDQAKSLLMKELAFAKRIPEAQMTADVAAMFSA